MFSRRNSQPFRFLQCSSVVYYTPHFSLQQANILFHMMKIHVQFYFEETAKTATTPVSVRIREVEFFFFSYGFDTFI